MRQHDSILMAELERFDVGDNKAWAIFHVGHTEVLSYGLYSDNIGVEWHVGKPGKLHIYRRLEFEHKHAVIHWMFPYVSRFDEIDAVTAKELDLFSLAKSGKYVELFNNLNNYIKIKDTDGQK